MRPTAGSARLLAPLGIRVAYTPLGIVVALAFVSLPFVVRTLQPVLGDLDREVERAAETLGASRLQSFLWVVLPSIWPALLTGVALGFSRAVGEYGSVIFIAGNIPKVSEIAPLMIMTKLEQYQYAQATAIAVVMLLASFALMFGINALQLWAQRRRGDERAMIRGQQIPEELGRYALLGDRAAVSGRCWWRCRWWSCSSRPSPRASAAISRRCSIPTRWPPCA